VRRLIIVGHDALRQYRLHKKEHDNASKKKGEKKPDLCSRPVEIAGLDYSRASYFDVCVCVSSYFEALS